ncbi:ferric reductase-like transmembrane domain-containing protein [Candidatus Micrarchaeota archaeon]|nr:ferric reductase-like transmembrane domain-containing protein [Candidatus Micrarchaeota archaeon]
MKIDYRPWLIVFLVIVSILFLYTAYDKQTKTLKLENLIKVLSFQDITYSLRELNKVAALAALGLLALVFIVGPLSKFWPVVFAKYLAYRKTVGVISFVIILLHTAYSLFIYYKLDPGSIFAQATLLPVIFGFIAFFIFLIMTITSTKSAVQKLGYKKWKTIQTCGYIGLLLVILHFFYIESKPTAGFDVRPYGLVIFYFAIAALLLRLGIIFVKTPERKLYEEHFGENEEGRKNSKKISGKK